MVKTVLITGTSSGIGKATAAYFWQKGWNVVATTRLPQSTDDRTMPTRMLCPQLDVTNPDTITSAIERSLERFGQIDVLVNNAGYGLAGALESLSIEQIQRQYNTNVFGLISVTQAVIPTMRSQRSGLIINVSSIGGRLAVPFSSVYHSTKWAVEGLSESLRFELRPFGIGVKLIEPGGIRTDFATRSMELVVKSPYDAMSRRMLQLYRDRMDKLPAPNGVARTIFKAATDCSEKLRYPVHHFPYLPMKQILPDFIWRRILGSVVDAPSEF